MTRTSWIGIRLAPEQKELIQRTAEIYGLTASEYLRILAVTHALTVTGHAPELQVPTLPQQETARRA